MSLRIGKEIWRRLKTQQSASKALLDLEQRIARNEAVPKTRLKASGQGRVTVFEGYRTLGLWHAKLDPSGQNQGDPILVFQRDVNGDLDAVALTDHESFTSSDQRRCREWLWEHRESIEWQRTPAAQKLLVDLEQEFDSPVPPRRGRW